MKKLILIALLILAPQVALAGTQTYSTPGTYTFAVPAYSSLTATVNGAGQGGQGGYAPDNSSGYTTNNPGAYGGSGGSSQFGATTESFGPITAQGGAGTGGAAGGVGGIGATLYSADSGNYIAPNGADGASGGQVARTYAAGALPGTIYIFVGAGGAGGTGATGYDVNGPGYLYAGNGSPGQNGSVTITWTDPAPTCSVTVDQNPITSGNSTTLRWSSSYASTFYISNVGYVAGSGSATITPNTTTSYAGTVSNATGNNSCGVTLTVNPACTANYGQACTSSANACGQTNAGTIQCGGTCSATTPPNSSCSNATCSVTFDANPAPYGTGTTMHWTSSNASLFTIQNVGAVTPNVAGSAHVAPSTATSYNGSGVGYNGNAFSCPATLNVSAPANPTATIGSSLGSTVKIGQSSTITASFAAGSGDSLVEDNIDGSAGNPAGWTGGLGANTNPTSPKSITFHPTVAGAYTFLARMRTAYYPLWTTYAQTSVTVPPLPNCSVNFDQNPITRGQSTVVHWSSSDATSFTLATMGPVTPNQSASATVSPQSTTDYSGTVVGAGGSFSCPATLTVQCTPSTVYSCSGQTIVRTDTAASCSTSVTNGTTCTSPSFCSAGSAVCLYPPPSYTVDGHLTVQPTLVRRSDTVSVYWNIFNVQSCTVTGTNGDSWTIAGTAANNWTSTPGASGETSRPITAQTTYELTCIGLDGSPTTPESVIVNILPKFKEI